VTAKVRQLKAALLLVDGVWIAFITSAALVNVALMGGEASSVLWTALALLCAALYFVVRGARKALKLEQLRDAAPLRASELLLLSVLAALYLLPLLPVGATPDVWVAIALPSLLGAAAFAVRQHVARH
jgi:hypothetical protein